MAFENRGSGLLSRVYNYHPERLKGLVFASVPYMEPGAFNLGTSTFSHLTPGQARPGHETNSPTESRPPC